MYKDTIFLIILPSRKGRSPDVTKTGSEIEVKTWLRSVTKLVPLESTISIFDLVNKALVFGEFGLVIAMTFEKHFDSSSASIT